MENGEKTMDFWNWLWVAAFPALWLGLWFGITRAGQRALSRHLTERQAPAVVVPKKLDEKAEWQKQFLELKQKTCAKHEYDGNRMQGWWKCVHCEQEQEWHYSGGCACFVMPERKLTDAQFTFVLRDRNRFCTIHGRAPAVMAIKNFEDQILRNSARGDKL